MFDIVAYIAQRCVSEPDRADAPEHLREELLDAGYPEDEVERAFAWLRRLRSRRVADLLRMDLPSPSIRCWTADEESKLTSDARGLLLRLERGGFLTLALREAVCERALALDLPAVGATEMRVLLSLVLRTSGRNGEMLASKILCGDLENLYH